MSLIIVMSLLYMLIALVIYVWLGGICSVSKSFFISVVGMLSFYLNKEEKALISTYEQYRVFNEGIVPIQLISAMLILMFIAIIATAVSMFTEGSRMNATFTQAVKVKEAKVNFRIFKWFIDGITNNITATWSNRAQKYHV